MFKEKLSVEQQHDILNNLFGFEYINVSKKGEKPSYVLYDDDGDEFFGYDKNLRFNFNTLEGIFSYAVNRAKSQGYIDCQYDLRKALGIS